MARTGRSGTAYGSVSMSARALSSVSGGPDTAYGPTMRAAGLGAGAGAAALDAPSAGTPRSRTCSVTLSFTAYWRSAARGADGVGEDRTRCMSCGAAEGAAAVSVAAGVVRALGAATCLGRTPDPRYRPAPSATTTVAAHASGS